jgi:hypothetical protein
MNIKDCAIVRVNSNEGKGLLVLDESKEHLTRASK